MCPRTFWHFFAENSGCVMPDRRERGQRTAPQLLSRSNLNFAVHLSDRGA
jgi:hypothetical protein